MRKENATVREAARWMRVSPSTVQRHRSLGVLIPEFRSQRLARWFAVELCRLVVRREARAR